MANKLGILSYSYKEKSGIKKEIVALIDDLFNGVMNYCRTDVTLMFKALEK